MAETDYSEPAHVLYDWANENAPLDDQEHWVISQTESEVDSYHGRPDIQEDVALTGLGKLVGMRKQAEQDGTVVELRRRETSNMIRTVYQATRYDAETRKPLPIA
jgi:hypothetical protein